VAWRHAIAKARSILGPVKAEYIRQLRHSVPLKPIRGPS